MVPDDIFSRVKPEEVFPLSQTLVQALVAAGSLATSADNCQPWLFTFDGGTLALRADPERSGFFYDVNHESTYMTLGTVVENIRIAASHHGLRLGLRLFPAGEGEGRPVAEMVFKKDEIYEDALFPFLGQRCVNRKLFSKRTIEQKLLLEIKAAIQMFPGVDLIWISAEAHKRKMRKIVYLSDRVLFENESLHSGLFKWIWVNPEDQDRLDGMGFDVLELGPLRQPFFRLLANWKSMSLLNKMGLSCIPGVNSLLMLRSAPVYGLITLKNRTPEGYVQTGMAMERFWIAANAHGLEVQPMAGFVFLLNHQRHDGAARFRPRHLGMIDLMSRFLQELPMIVPEEIPAMFFRVGYAPRPSARTRRLPVEEILSFDG